MFSKNILFFVFKNRKQKTVFCYQTWFFFSIKYKTVLENSYQTSPKSFVFHVFILRKALQMDGWIKNLLVHNNILFFLFIFSINENQLNRS